MGLIETQNIGVFLSLVAYRLSKTTTTNITGPKIELYSAISKIRKCVCSDGTAFWIESNDSSYCGNAKDREEEISAPVAEPESKVYPWVSCGVTEIPMTEYRFENKIRARISVKYQRMDNISTSISREECANEADHYLTHGKRVMESDYKCSGNGFGISEEMKEKKI